MSGTFRRFEILLPLRFNDGRAVPSEIIAMTLLEGMADADANVHWCRGIESESVPAAIWSPHSMSIELSETNDFCAIVHKPAASDLEPSLSVDAVRAQPRVV